MLLRKAISRARSQDWFALAIEIVVLVPGIVLGLQASDWADGRRQRTEEHDYLERLLADSDANLAELRRALEAYQQAAATILSICRRLLLIRDQRLRAQLASEDSAHMEARRLDVLIPAVQRAAEPINPFRSWYIDTTRSPIQTRCRFDIEGMRREPRVASALAQLYRDQVNHANFTKREIVAVEVTHAMLLAALGRADEVGTGITR